MASDGDIDDREIAIVKKMCTESGGLKNIDIVDAINNLVEEINRDQKRFVSNFFEELNNIKFSKKEELSLIDFAIHTIKADDQIDYAEIKFFKAFRHCLVVSNDDILKAYPDIQELMEEDIETESYYDKIVGNYLETTNLPQFKLIVKDDIA